MALVLIDNFEQTDDLAARYSVGSNIATSSAKARSGSYSIAGVNNSGSGSYIDYTCPAVSSGYVGLAIWFDQTHSSTRTIVNFIYSGTTQCSVALNASGAVCLYRGALGTLLKTSVKIIPGSRWQYIEIKWKIADSCSAGDFEVRVNGETFLSCDAATDTKFHASNATVDTIKFHAYRSTGGQMTYIDDIYIIDTTGSNNTWLGPIAIETLIPDANGYSSQFTGSDGNSTDNYLLVDEAVEDADTTYVESSNVGDIDSYGVSDFSVSPSSIVGVQIESYSKKTSTDVRTFKHIVRIGSTNYESSAFTLGESYGNFFNVYDVSPATTSAWSESEIEGMEFGIKVEA